MSLLTIENLSKECENLKLLKDVNLSLTEGKCIGIKCSGETGELFFNMISGKILPSKGSIHIEDKPVKEYPHVESKVGVIFKEEGMYDRLKLCEYMDFFKKIYNYNGSEKDILIKLGLLDIEDKKIKTLTYSQKKRLSIARTMLSNPKILLIQEPTLNVDRESASIIREYIFHICSLGISVIAVSVSMEEIILLGGDNYVLDEKGFYPIETDASDEDTSEANATSLTSDNQSFKIDKIPAKINDKIILFNPTEIISIESLNGTSYLNLGEESFPCTLTLNELEYRLKSFGFFRCHRSYLVNLQRVREVVTWTRNSFSLVLDDKNKTSIPLSKGRMEELKHILGL